MLKSAKTDDKAKQKQLDANKSFQQRKEEAQKEAEAADLSRRFFDLINKRKGGKFPGMEKHKEFEPNKMLLLQEISFVFENECTVFSFDASKKEAVEEFELFYGDFMQAFKAKYPDNDCMLEIKAYSQESLDQALRALEEKGIKVDAILLVDASGKRIKDLSKKEDVDAYYAQLNKPADDSGLDASASSAAAASGHRDGGSPSSRRSTLG